MNCPATHIQSNRKDDHFSKLLVGLEQSIESPAFSSENGTFTFAEMTLLTFPFPATKVVATYRPQLILAKMGKVGEPAISGDCGSSGAVVSQGSQLFSIPRLKD